MKASEPTLARSLHPCYLMLMGLLTTVLVVGVGAAFPSGPGRYVVSATWALVRVLVEVSDSVLSQHVTSLEQAGYVTVTRGQLGRRPRTGLSLTLDGRVAFRDRLAVLEEIAASGG